MYLRIRAGLLEPKHVKAMGNAVWLYLWLHGRVQFKGEEAGCTFSKQPYRHAEAAAALDVSEGAIRVWFRALVQGGYVTARQLQHGLVVAITKYGGGAEGAKREAPSAPQGVKNVTPRVSNPQHPERKNVTPSKPSTRSVRVKPIQESIQEIVQRAPAPRVAAHERPRDLIWDALAGLFGEPVTPMERGQRNAAVKQFREAGKALKLPDEAVAGLIMQAHKNWPAVMPEGARATPHALAKHFSLLLAKGKPIKPVLEPTADRPVEPVPPAKKVEFADPKELEALKMANAALSLEERMARWKARSVGGAA